MRSTEETIYELLCATIKTLRLTCISEILVHNYNAHPNDLSLTFTHDM